jgi:DnaK suppressor protein
MTALPKTDPRQVAEQLRERRRVLQQEIRDALLREGTERYADIAQRLMDAQGASLAGLLAEVRHADVARDAEEIGDLDAALQRIAHGSWGTCIRCGESIAAERLEAWPTAKRCLRCQRIHEEEKAGVGAGRAL